MLNFDNVNATIDKISVLRDITVSLPKGSITAVVGRNGAGKTTLLRSVMGALPLDSGRIFLDGQDLSRIPPHQRITLGVGYAPQDRALFPSMTVQGNLEFPCRLAGYTKAETAERLRLTLEIVPQLREMLPRSGAALSGGQGKMAALGRSLMVGTRLILLDEPFQGLAPALAIQYGEALQRLHERVPDLCIVVTESNIGLLKDIPNQVLYIERGELAPEVENENKKNSADLSATVQAE